jgi:hypothetical protein
VRYLPRGAADDRPGHRFLPLATTGVPRDLKGPILLPSLAPDSTHSSFTTPHVLVSLTRERTSRCHRYGPQSPHSLLPQDISKDIIDIMVHLLGKGVVSSPMNFLLSNFQLDSLHRFDTVCPPSSSPSFVDRP